MMPAARLGFDSGLQCVDRTALLGRTLPGVVSNIGSFGRVPIAWIAAHRVRRKEKFHALNASGRRGRVRWSIYHTAGDPLCAGRHPNLVASAVVADRHASGPATMEHVVARLRRVVAARIADAVMDGVMPVVIVIGRLSVPATILRFKGVMRPANTGIGAPNNNSLAGETEVPNLRRVRVINS